MFKQSNRATVFCLLGSALLSAASFADDWIVFRMGEDDPGAVAEQFTSFTRDTTGSYQFTKINANPMRSSNVAPGQESELALDFMGAFSGKVLRQPLIPSSSNAFTVDGWFFVRHTGTRWLFQFGQYGFNGFGAYTTAGNFWGIYQGAGRRPVAWDTGIPVVGNQWVRVTLSYENQSFNLYINGVKGTTQPATDLIHPADLVTIGARSVFRSSALEREDFEAHMDGLIDEWRIHPTAAIRPNSF
jgi:hypothetical protein